MTETINISPEELPGLKDRLQKLAMEKSYLNLVIHMMSGLSAVAGIENLVENMLQVILGNIGGTNLIIYYLVDQDIYYADVLGKKMKLDFIEDVHARGVWESHEQAEYEEDFSSTLMMTPEFTKARTWVFPLLVGSELIGVIKMEGMHLGTREMQKYLPTFFSFAALILKNEIRGHTRLQQAFDELQKFNVKLANEIDERMLAEKALRERVKELRCLYSVADIIENTDSTEELLQKTANAMPPGFFYPENACARIILSALEFKTENFHETEWKLSDDITVSGKPVGKIEVCYLARMPDLDEGPFLKEERSLIRAIAERLGRVMERKQAEEEKEKLIVELRSALSEVKTLSGLLPICASCKKIRNDKGYWEQLEGYIGKRSEAVFSHGVCPECAKKIMEDNPGPFLRRKREGKVVILFADDEADFRLLFIRQMRRFCKDCELDFIEADNGEDAWQLLKRGVKPSVMIFDNIMPKINGIALLRIIDMQNPELSNIPRILISGSGNEQIISEAKSLRCVFFEKGISVEKFAQQICRHILETLGIGKNE